MSVEQTTQLIALIFNSALLLLLCGLVWGGAWYRQQVLISQIQQTQHSQQLLFVNARPNREPRLQQLRQQRQRQQRQFRLAYGSMMVLHYTLVVLALSVLLLGLRMLVFANVLISLALLLFVAGAAGLVLALLLLLADIHQVPVLGKALLDWCRQLVQQITHLRSPASTPHALAQLKGPVQTPRFTMAWHKTGTDA